MAQRTLTAQTCLASPAMETQATTDYTALSTNLPSGLTHPDWMAAEATSTLFVPKTTKNSHICAPTPWP